jgi:hypothetical protein
MACSIVGVDPVWGFSTLLLRNMFPALKKNELFFHHQGQNN